MQRMTVEIFFSNDNVGEIMEPIKAIEGVSEAYIDEGPDEVDPEDESEDDRDDAPVE